MNVRKFPLLTLPLLALTLTLPLQGCLSSLVTKPIIEANKDTSGAFEGQWAGVVEHTAATQQGPGNWRFDCNDRSGDKFAIAVNNGQATLPLMNRQNTTYVSSDGKFRFEVPTDSDVKASGTSDSSVNNGAVTLILSGSLSAQTGYFVIGIAEFANAGCTSKVAFEKL